MPSAVNERYRALISQRLSAISSALLGDRVPIASSGDPVLSLLRPLAESVRADPGDGRLWLLFTALAGAFPTSPQLDDLRRRLTLADEEESVRVLLAETRAAAGRYGDWERPLRLVDGGIVIDVNFCAKFAHNTGIQRVVREVVPQLIAHAADRAIELVAWTRQAGAYRTLAAVEHQRVVDWRALAAGASVIPEEQEQVLLVPWRSRVLLPEVPEPELCDRLAALAEHSGNAVSIVGHDLIPISSAEMVSVRESDRFAHYLTVIKHVRRVVTVSESVAREFRGFTAALAAQGLTGPEIRTSTLAADVPTPGAVEHDGTVLPLVLCVGSHEPRKNQDAVLFAVETLLREGIAFRAVFVGGGDRDRTLPFDAHLERLRVDHGFDVQSLRGLRDTELWALYRDARFTVLTSLHEGFGLPVVESRALGTPVLTSDYGSLAEIGAAGGCVLVDPRDDDAIVGQMRRMLTDDALLERLHAEVAALPPRSWRDYAAQLWDEALLGVAP